MGKAEGHGTNWHGHVTALTVSPDYRRLGLAAILMQFLEDVSEKYDYRLKSLRNALISRFFFFQKKVFLRRSVCSG
jgi:ribosomal protein S18 acetylase RimI-like enzyme